MKKVIVLIICLVFINLTLIGDVIITGIVDGPLTGGYPKAIELYISGTENLANYSVYKSSNGGSWGSVIAAMSGSYTDEYVYLTSDLTSFQSVFGTSGDFSNNHVNTHPHLCLQHTLLNPQSYQGG